MTSIVPPPSDGGETPHDRTVVIAPQGHGWAVITRYHGGRWDGFTTTYYCRWRWQADREFDRQMRRATRG